MILKGLYSYIYKFRALVSLLIIFFISLFFNIKISKLNILFAVDKIFFPIEYSIMFIKDFTSIKQENDILKIMNQELLLQNRELNILLKQKMGISKKQSIKTGYSYKVIPVNPISFYPDLKGNYLIVNGGENLGIKKDMGVVDFNGIVGKVVKTTKTSSLIQFISDPEFRVSVYNPHTGAFGILKNDNSKDYYLDFINDDEKFFVGDTLLSSGLGGIFPKNIFVCRVISITDNRFSSFKRINVELFSKIRKPKEYFIIDNINKTNLEW